MRYLKGYQKFINESIKDIDNNSMIVEKQILEEFSSNFWDICMKSDVFTVSEKSYISNNLLKEEVSLIKEEWEWLDKSVNWAKDKGDKMLNYVSSKIKSIKDGIKEFVASMITYAKSIFTSGVKSSLGQSVKFVEKVSKNQVIATKIKELDVEKSKTEVEDLKKTFQHWAPGKTAKESKPNVDVVAGKIDAVLKSGEANVISSTTKNLEEAENETKNESISSIISNTNDDVLMSFYKISLIKESEEGAETAKKSTGMVVVDWILSFLGQEKIDPDAKAGKKLLWWGKLFLKILSTVFSPILATVEFIVKKGANLVLKGVSTLTAKFGGPGVFEFTLLGGLCGGIVGVVYDSMMLFGSHVGGADAMAIVKAWLAHAINGSLELFPSYKTLKYIFAGFCAGMTLWHVIEEIKHLAHGGHDEHGHESTKPVVGKPAPVGGTSSPAPTGGTPAPAPTH